jgi:hypothetical protein
MGRTSHSNYIEAARQVMGELGGGPISSRDLVAAAQERGLVGNGTWVYHNFLRKVRESDEFDTSRRGYVAMPDGAPPMAEPVAEVVAPDFGEVQTDEVLENVEVTEAPVADGPDDGPLAENVNPFVETA